MTTNQPADTKKSDRGKPWIGKAISIASMGFSAVQIFGHQQKASAAEAAAEAAASSANEQIAMASAAVASANANAAAHIANVAGTVDMVNAAANADIANAIASVDAANALADIVTNGNVVDAAGTMAELSESVDAGGTIFESLLDWF
jgi:hypothetical protein